MSTDDSAYLAGDNLVADGASPAPSDPVVDDARTRASIEERAAEPAAEVDATHGNSNAPDLPSAPATPEASNSTLGTLALIGAVLIFSSNGAVYKKMYTHDSELFSVCNVLCGANLFGLVTLVPLFRRQLTLANLRAITAAQRRALIAGTLCYSVFGPLFYLLALQRITVASSAILARLESLEFLALSTVVLRARVDRWARANALATLVGVAAALLSPPLFGAPLELSAGAALMVASGLFFVASLLITKRWLAAIPTGVLAVFRVGVGTLIYHLTVVARGDVRPGTRRLFWDARYWRAVWWSVSRARAAPPPRRVTAALAGTGWCTSRSRRACG